MSEEELDRYLDAIVGIDVFNVRMWEYIPKYRILPSCKKKRKKVKKI